MRRLVLIIFLLLISLVQANTTFFDNPDDVFIMSNPATGGVTGGTTGQITNGAAGQGGCRYEWNCTNWSECFSSGKQTRNCTNIGTCLDTYKTPEIEQNCTPEIVWEEVENKNPFYLIIILLTLIVIIFYLKKVVLRLANRFNKHLKSR